MDSIKTTGAALAGTSLVLLVLVQFLPWASSDGSEMGIEYEVEARTWEAQADVSVSGGTFGEDFGGSETHGWYDDEADDSDGVTQIRIAIPFLVVGMLAALIATILGFAARGPAGSFVTLAAALLTIVATVLFIQGLDSFFEEGGVDKQWGASFYLAIASCVLLVAGGVLGLVGGNRSRAGAA